jgi:alcohol dehydrogenase (NADP+)
MISDRSPCRYRRSPYTGTAFVATYNGPTADAPGHRLGGYSQRIARSGGLARCRGDAGARRSFHFILDTVAANHDLDAYTGPLRRDGTLCLVGAPAEGHPSPSVFPLVYGRRAIAGSLIGGLPETQEMLDFCAEHGMAADIEMIDADAIETAYERMLRSDVKYRVVIDIASMGGGDFAGRVGAGSRLAPG